jgi:hypothetical protein
MGCMCAMPRWSLMFSNHARGDLNVGLLGDEAAASTARLRHDFTIGLVQGLTVGNGPPQRTNDSPGSGGGTVSPDKCRSARGGARHAGRSGREDACPGRTRIQRGMQR